MKTTFFKRLLLGLGMVAALSSCSLDDDSNNNYDTPNAALGLIANASPNSGDLYFFADTNQVNTAALNYTNAKGYYPFYTGNRVLTVKDGAGKVLATSNVSLALGEYFSAFAVNTFNSIELVTYQDALQYPSSGHARVRFINLSPDAAPIDIKSGTQNFATALAFKGTTDFTEVPAGSYDISFTNSATSAALFTDTAVQFERGGIYTIYTKGFVTPAAGSNDTFSAEKMRNY